MIKISAKSKTISGSINLEASKSISNRLLIIRELSDNKFNIENLSNAKDTRILTKILNDFKSQKYIDCEDAGTALRFSLAFLATKDGNWVVSGSKRMHKRPIKPLVDCLLELGAEIKYLENEGFPPIEIKSKNLKSKKISLPGDISSQFISALLLVAPTIENGLTLEITSKVLSKPYIKMTLELMSEFGINYSWKNNLIKIEKQRYIGKKIMVENDWSAASFWYSFVALSKTGKIEIPKLNKSSIQGDSILSEKFSNLGVKTSFKKNSIILSRNSKLVKELELDLSNHPDLALPIIVTCCGLGTKAHLMGLESLKVKESNRLECIKKELRKFNISCEIDSSSIKIRENQKIVQPTSIIECHNDHRIAMSIAPLCMKVDSISFENKNVVNKSYPDFWKDLELAGINCVNS
jgi:3-phosphoshikimate 1-carboxyvinyltransferase